MSFPLLLLSTGASTSSLASLSYRLHSDLASSLSGPERWGYRHLETLSVSADLSPSQARAKKSSVDARFDWLNKDALRETSQLGTKESTSQVHPRLFTEAMAEEAKKAGVKVVAATATGLQRTEGGGFTILAGDQSFAASEVVVTAGPWTGKVLKQLGLKGGRASGIGGSRAHSVVLKTAEGRDLPAQALFTSIKEGRGMSEPEIYVRRFTFTPSPRSTDPSFPFHRSQNRPDGTAYACGPTDSSPLPSLASEVKVDEQAIASIISQAGGLSPNYLAVNDSPHSATVVAKQACYLPVGSGDPVIGELEKGIYVGAGHSCWGITNGEFLLRQSCCLLSLRAPR